MKYNFDSHKITETKSGYIYGLWTNTFTSQKKTFVRGELNVFVEGLNDDVERVAGCWAMSN